MKATIEKYRGFEIWFDTDTESFQCDIDNEKSIKKSYPALKKFIDEYIKENNKFIPFLVESNPNGRWAPTVKKGKITGIRKDGRYILTDEEGHSAQVSDWDLEKYIMVHVKNKVIWEELKTHQEYRDKTEKELYEKEEQIKKKFIIITLKQYKELNK